MLLTARYVMPVTAPWIEDGAVLLRDDEIVEVGTAADLVARHPEEEVRDFGLAAILPGFVDVHTHLEYSVFRGLVDDAPYSKWKMQLLEKEKRLEPKDWDDSAELGVLEAIQSGITTVADMTSTGASLRAATAAGLRGIFYRAVATMDRSRVTEVIADALEDIATWRLFAEGSPVRIGIAPHSPYSCHPQVYRAVGELARIEGLPVATHVAGTKDEYNFVKWGSSPMAYDVQNAGDWDEFPWMPTGVSPMRYLLQYGVFDVPNFVAVHAVHLDDDDFQILVDYDVAVAYCPRCNAKLGMGVAPLKRFMDRGIRIGIGTDSPASNNTIDFFDEMRIGLLMQRAVTLDVESFTAARMIRMATIWGARALRMEDEVGSLEPGKQADIVVVDLSKSHQIPTQDPYGAIVHATNQENVAMTMVGGKVLFDHNQPVTVDRTAIKQRAEKMRTVLRG
jgi:5-methylthioadenosine/S-adenosylhomocysteine deaminase